MNSLESVFGLESIFFKYAIYFSNCNVCSMSTVPVSNNNRNNIIENTHHRADCESCYSEPPDPITNVSNLEAASLYFNDGERLIDFVLVWKGDEDDDPKQIESKREKRAIFEENLFTEGLELERESFELLHFTKVHVTIEVLRRYSEILKLRMPMKDVSSERALLMKCCLLECQNSLFQSLCKIQEQNRFSHISNAAHYFSHKVRSFKNNISLTLIVLGLKKITS